MPKQEEIDEESEDNESAEEKNKDNQSDDEDSELEEIVELKEEFQETQIPIDDFQFQEFLQPTTQASAPVLQRVNNAPQVNLEQDIAIAPTSTQPTQRIRDYSTTVNTPDYSTGTHEQEQTQTNYEPPVLRPVNTGSQDEQIFIDPFANMRTNNQNNIQQRAIQPEFEQQTRRLPFEKQERKYKNVKL